jgi:repressor LexA
MKTPTKRQLQMLRVIDDHTRSNGYPPTIREIGWAMKIRSTNGVNDLRLILERDGWLRAAPKNDRKQPVTSRALVLTASGHMAIGNKFCPTCGTACTPAALRAILDGVVT